jgi:hypothetical protein
VGDSEFHVVSYHFYSYFPSAKGLSDPCVSLLRNGDPPLAQSPNRPPPVYDESLRAPNHSVPSKFSFQLRRNAHRPLQCSRIPGGKRTNGAADAQAAHPETTVPQNKQKKDTTMIHQKGAVF